MCLEDDLESKKTREAKGLAQKIGIYTIFCKNMYLQSLASICVNQVCGFVTFCCFAMFLSVHPLTKHYTPKLC